MHIPLNNEVIKAYANTFFVKLTHIIIYYHFIFVKKENI